jgi:hypothetical protein
MWGKPELVQLKPKEALREKLLKMLFPVGWLYFLWLQCIFLHLCQKKKEKRKLCQNDPSLTRNLLMDLAYILGWHGQKYINSEEIREYHVT